MVNIRDAVMALSLLGGTINMLKIILSLLGSLGTLEADVEGVVNEIKDAPNGQSALINSISALRKLADDIEAAIS